MAIAISFIGTVPIQAHEENSNKIEPRYVASCSGGGKHTMRAIANSMMYDKPGGKLLYGWGSASKCSKCNIMIFSRYYPKGQTNYLGVYKVQYGAYSGSQIYVVYGYDGFYWNMQGDDFIRGFEWY